MRDQEAVQKLKVLENKKPIIPQEKGLELIKFSPFLAQEQVLELIELSPFFTQPAVSSFLEQNKDLLTHLRDLILLAHSKVEDLSSEKITAIAFASVLFGGSCWTSLPRAFNRLDSARLEDVLLSLRSLLATKFGERLAKWFCISWRYIEEQTLLLLKYLKQQSLENELSADIATLSRAVQITDVSRCTMTAKAFSQFPTFRLMLSAINASAAQWN